MNLVAVNFGSYPRIGDSPDQQVLLGAESMRPADLDRARQGVIRDVIAEQAKAGLDAVSDGHVRRADPVSHTMLRLSNVSAGGLRRYFDTGLLYRRPAVQGPVALRDTSLVADEVRWAAAVGARAVAASMAGPLTLSRLCDLRGGAFASADALMDALVPILADEVERVAAAGAWGLVIEEPALLGEPGVLPRLNDALEVMAARRGDLRLWFYPSGGDAGGLWEGLQGLPVDGLVLDMTRGGGAASALASSGSRMPVLLGMADTRTTRVETPGRLAKAAGPLVAAVRPQLAGLVPAGPLESLPRAVAFGKCRALALARDALLGRSRRPRKSPRRRGRR